MKKILVFLGVVEDKTPVFITRSYKRDPLPASEMSAFTEWCKTLNVSLLANKDNHFTVTIGDHEKVVKLDDRF